MVMIGAKHILLVALLAQASAPPAGAEDKAKAKVLLHEGLDFNRQGHYAEALEKFQAAYAAYPSPKLWFNIGQVERALNHPVEAVEAFQKFLALVPDAEPENKEVAKSAVAEIESKLGRVRIKCETPGAEVVIDGKNVGPVPLPEPLWATPGSHRVTITHVGFAPATENVEVSAGSTALVVIRLAPPSPPAEITPPPAVTEAEGAALPPGTEPWTVPPAPEPTPAEVPPLPVAAPFPATPAALDLTVQPAPAQDQSQARPIYKTWWFWTGAGVVAAGAVTTAILLSGQGGSNVPETELGDHGVLP